MIARDYTFTLHLKMYILNVDGLYTKLATNFPRQVQVKHICPQSAYLNLIVYGTCKLSNGFGMIAGC